MMWSAGRSALTGRGPPAGPLLCAAQRREALREVAEDLGGPGALLLLAHRDLRLPLLVSPAQGRRILVQRATDGS